MRYNLPYKASNRGLLAKVSADTDHRKSSETIVNCAQIPKDNVLRFSSLGYSGFASTIALSLLIVGTDLMRFNGQTCLLREYAKR